MPFFLSQTNKTIRRIKTDLALDSGEAALTRNSAGRSTWHGRTDTVLKETDLDFDNNSPDKLRHILSEEEDRYERKHTPQERTSQTRSITAAGDVNKTSMSNILLTKSNFSAEGSNSCEKQVTSVKII